MLAQPERVGSCGAPTSDLVGVVVPAPPARSLDLSRSGSRWRLRIGLALCLVTGWGCRDATGPLDWSGASPAGIDYRAEMRAFVATIASYAQAQQPGFVVVIRNGLPLLTENGYPDGPFLPTFVDAISGVVRDGVHYNLDGDGSPAEPVPAAELTGYLDRLVDACTPVLATSYCQTAAEIDDAYLSSIARGYLAFAVLGPLCDVIPDYPASPPSAHDGTVAQLGDARNYLPLLTPEPASDREQYLNLLAATDYDVLIVDAFHDGVMLTEAELGTLKTKCHGGRRLVLASFCCGVADVDRDYWCPEWETDRPSWLEPADSEQSETRFVRYWDPGWRDLMLGRPDAYLDRIIAAGFDGVLLDRVDSYEYFEDCYG